MSDSFIGIMWNKNEGDILEEIISSYIKQLDSLFIADDGSTDDSWEIIKDLKERFPDKIEHIQQNPSVDDPAQRTSLLNEVKKRYKPENTWVVAAESDTMILDTNLKEIVSTQSQGDALTLWLMINAVRQDNWKKEDNYPNWSKPITEIMNYGYCMERGFWMFRPLDELYYDKAKWRPWPKGFNKYIKDIYYGADSFNLPLIAHYGYRGPTHFYEKLKRNNMVGRKYTKYPDWDTSSIESIRDTVWFFNKKYKSFPLNRQGFKNHDFSTK